MGERGSRKSDRKFAKTWTKNSIRNFGIVAHDDAKADCKLQPTLQSAVSYRHGESRAFHVMTTVDTLIGARWVIPVEPAGLVLENHSLALCGGRIAELLPTAEALVRYPHAARIDRPTHVLLPGFVNAHTHAAMTLLRGTAENLALDDWLRQRIWPLEQRWMDAHYTRDGTSLALAAMLLSGTTTVGDMHLFPETVAQVADAFGIRACIGLVVLDAPTAWATSADEYLSKGARLHDQYRGHPLVSTAFAPHAPYTVSDETFTRIQRMADEIELPVMVHLHESENEVAQALADSAERPLARLQRLGLLTPLLCAIHMTQLDEADVATVARTGINVVHCPQSNLKLQNGRSPIRTLLAQGVNVALGTDGAASNNDLDMIDETRTAGLLANGFKEAAPTLGSHELLRMATLNGARALGQGQVSGSLLAGKSADLCCMDLNYLDTQPVHDPAAQIVYAAARHQVSDVWVAGRQLVAGGKLTQVDVPELLERAARWQQKIASRA
jgi:5-methylthioadenosine/S-adenosylhomocysteine deaminase